MWNWLRRNRPVLYVGKGSTPIELRAIDAHVMRTKIRIELGSRRVSDPGPLVRGGWDALTEAASGSRDPTVLELNDLASLHGRRLRAASRFEPARDGALRESAAILRCTRRLNEVASGLSVLCLRYGRSREIDRRQARSVVDRLRRLPEELRSAISYLAISSVTEIELRAFSHAFHRLREVDGVHRSTFIEIVQREFDREEAMTERTKTSTASKPAARRPDALSTEIVPSEDSADLDIAVILDEMRTVIGFERLFSPHAWLPAAGSPADRGRHMRPRYPSYARDALRRTLLSKVGR